PGYDYTSIMNYPYRNDGTACGISQIDPGKRLHVGAPGDPNSLYDASDPTSPERHLSNNDVLVINQIYNAVPDLGLEVGNYYNLVPKHAARSLRSPVLSPKDPGKKRWASLTEVLLQEKLNGKLPRDEWELSPDGAGSIKIMHHASKKCLR